MKICEIYKSLQGESKNQGLVTTFVRLSGCNENCIWCDSKYHIKGKEMNVDEVVTKIKSLKCNNVCITGGEPLLQMQDLIRLIEEIEEYNISIETNGTLPIDDLLDYVGIKFVLDYKPKSAKSINKFCWGNLLALSALDEIKFVIDNKDDYVEAKKIVNKIRKQNKDVILSFSPTQKVKLDLAKWMIDDNFIKANYAIQLHKILWGNKRKI